MSNPAICYLSKTSIAGVYFAIEDNLGEAIHIHYGNARISLTIQQFLELSNYIIEAAKELFAKRNLNWDYFSIFSFKEEWIVRYKYISETQRVNLPLKSLRVKESYVNCRKIKRIIPLSEAGYIKYLESKYDKEYYEEQGIYELSRSEKLKLVKQNIISRGYPYDDTDILIDQDGYILDGNKRASCLYYLYGADYVVPVKKINIKWDKNIEERTQIAENQIDEFMRKSNSCNNPADSKNQEKPTILMEELVAAIKKLHIKHVVIKNRTDTFFNCKAYILIEKNKIAVLSEYLSCKENKDTDNLLNTYTFAYSVNMPLIYETEFGRVLVHDRFLVNSKFMSNIIVPLDKTVNEWLLKNSLYDATDAVETLNPKGKVVLDVILDVYYGKTFSNELKESIRNNKELWKQDDVEKIFKSVFFQYGHKLIQHLYMNGFFEAVQEYVSFGDY